MLWLVINGHGMHTINIYNLIIIILYVYSKCIYIQYNNEGGEGKR